MTELIIRSGSAADLRQASDLLNTIVAAGGTTALTTELDREALGGWLLNDPDYSAWQVAETEAGDILGFQWIGRVDVLPPEACEIGTYVKTGQTGLGVGSKLFEATKTAARGLGFSWIRAIIRADNSGGLAYYQSRGFEDYDIVRDVVLDNGMVVDKRCKRYNL